MSISLNVYADNQKYVFARMLVSQTHVFGIYIEINGQGLAIYGENNEKDLIKN